MKNFPFFQQIHDTISIQTVMCRLRCIRFEKDLSNIIIWNAYLVEQFTIFLLYLINFDLLS